MKERHELWDELEKQKAQLEAQEERFYQQLRMLTEAAMAGQITDWDEMEDLMFELIGFGDYYRPAWELHTQLRCYVEKHFSPYVQHGGTLTRLPI